MADSGRLTQVLVNLLVNASDALRDDSPRSNRISVSTRGAREGVTIVVEDTGCGVDPAVQERMFEPFYSTKRDGLGTGLGLSITADIVSEHRGRISIESEVGAGTRIEVSLPYQQGAMTSPPPTVETHQASACRSGVRVLLVDDEPLNLSVLGRILGRSHDVVTAGGGADALAIIEADTEIDVVVCDLMMAGVDGAAVYEAIAARRPDLADRVLVITAGATSNRTRAFVEAHADQVMYKPLEAPRLLAAIDALVAGEPPQP